MRLPEVLPFLVRCLPSYNAPTSALASLFPYIASTNLNIRSNHRTHAEHIIIKECSDANPLQRRTLWLQSQYRRLSVRKRIPHPGLGATNMGRASFRARAAHLSASVSDHGRSVDRSEFTQYVVHASSWISLKGGNWPRSRKTVVIGAHVDNSQTVPYASSKPSS